jgi:anti-anti-sigma factor
MARPFVGPPEIQLGGEIDLANAVPIGDALCRALSRRQLPLAVDLAEVTSIDASAIAMMLHVHHHAEALGVGVSWTNPRRQARVVLRITAVDHVLLIEANAPGPPQAASA